MKKFYIASTFLFLFIINGFAGYHANPIINNNLSLVVTATVTQSNVTCNGQCNGSATVTASGGGAPYSYQWMPVPASTPTVNGLCAGSYTVIVTDASSATTTVVFTITQPPPLNLSSSASSSICPGSCKTLTAIASGGTPPYAYTWQPGNITGGTITVCPAGTTTYTIMASDNYSCVAMSSVMVSITNTVANAGPTKSITCVNATAILNGSGLSTYSWSGPGIISGASTASPTVGSPGVYSLTGTNGGCSSNTATVMVVLNTTPPNVTMASSSNTVCSGNTVTLTANLSAGVTYSWSNGAFTNTTVVSPTASTSYTVWVTNTSNGCTGSASQGIGVSPSPTVTAYSFSATCNGGSGCLNAYGANTYTWVGPCGFTSTSAAPCFPFNLACACTFSVIGATANGCTNTATVCLNISSPSVSVLTSDSLICTGQTATLTANGASTYTWSSSSTATSIAVSPSVNTTYTLTGADGLGCIAGTVYTQSVSACTGIKNSSGERNDLPIYPNPFEGVLIINANTAGTLIIYHAIGEKVLTQKLVGGINTIDLNEQPKGIYFVKFGSIIKKVVRE